jgi:aryl-alcohol dehydrogenase-like predicted oxidoreductase
MGIMAWSPLASGLLSGKYRQSHKGAAGDGRLQTLRDNANPAFHKFTERNWRIVAALEKVSSQLDRSMAQVALNWAANRPGIATLIVGATRLEQLDDNLEALDFELPAELAALLEQAGHPERQFPYFFFEPELQGMIYGGATAADKPAGYYEPVRVSGAGAGVQ